MIDDGAAGATPATGRRGLLIDAALGAAVSAVVAGAITADLGGIRGPELFAYLFAICLGLLMLVRRQFPVLALVASAVGLLAYYIAGYPPIGLAIPVAAALYSAAEAGKLRWALGVGAALLVISTTFRVAEGTDLRYLFGYELAITVGLMSSVIALGDSLRARRLVRAAQRRRERELELERDREAARLLEEERLRIARELHDVLAHTVAVVSVQADVAAEALEDDPRAVAASLATIRSASDTAVRELRATIGLLREPDEAASRSPTGSLEYLDTVVEATTSSGLSVDVRVEGKPVPLPVVVDTTAYRIVQEALTNVLRHADASSTEVVLRYGGDELEVEVTDDGRGSNRADGDAGADGSGEGRGIAGMRERAALLGGRVEAATLPGRGFRVAAWLPLEVRS